MASYAPGPILNVEVMEDYILKHWPAKQEGSTFTRRLSLAVTEGFCEAVTVTLARQGNDYRIRDLVGAGHNAVYP